MDKQKSENFRFQKEIDLPLEKQEMLYEAVKSALSKDLTTKNCFALSLVGKRAGANIARSGLGRANKELFLHAPQYFVVGYNEKNEVSIMLCGYPIDPSFTRQRKSEYVLKFDKDTDALDQLYAGLQEAYKSIDVSEENVNGFIAANKDVLIQAFGDITNLFDRLSEKYECVVRDNGENTQQERFLVLRKPMPVPQNTVDSVKILVERFFTHQDLVSNSDIGKVFKDHGIIYSDYGYPDLTSFLRSFPNFFRIVPKPNRGSGTVQIYVRILKSNIEDSSTAQVEDIKAGLIKEISQGTFDFASDPNVLHSILEVGDPEIWDLALQAFAAKERGKFGTVDPLNSWEKLVITFDDSIFSAVNNRDFMLKNGISEAEQQTIIKKMTHLRKTCNFSSIGLRITTLCGDGNTHAVYFYLMGLIAGDEWDKKYCYRNYCTFCAKHYPDLFRQAWDESKDTYIDTSTMLSIAKYLTKAKCYKELIYAYNNMPKSAEGNDEIDTLYKCAVAQKDECDKDADSEDKEDLNEKLAMLFVARQFKKIVSLYENNAQVALENQTLNYVLHSYHELGDVSNAVSLKVSIIKKKRRTHEDILSDFRDTIDMAYSGVESEELFNLGEREASFLCNVAKDYQPNDQQWPKYYLVIMAFAIIAKYYGLCCLLFSLSSNNQEYRKRHEEILHPIQQALQNCREYAEHIDNFEGAYKHILTNECIDRVFLYSKIAGNVLRCSNSQRKPLDYKSIVSISGEDDGKITINVDSNGKEKEVVVDRKELIKDLIIDVDRVSSWIFLSKHTNKKNYQINYIANLVLAFHFNIKDSLRSCIFSLDHRGAGALAQNYLLNNIYFLNNNQQSNLYTPVEEYWTSLYRYCTSNMSFSNASTETVEACFSALITRKHLNKWECLLLIVILSQTNIEKSKCDQALFENPAVRECLLKHPDCLVRLFAFLVTEHRYSDLLELNERVMFLRGLIDYEKLSEEGKSAIQWLNALYEMKAKGEYRQKFFEATETWLIYYPCAPKDDESAIGVILPSDGNEELDYDLISYWINTFDSTKNINKTINYLLSSTRKHPEGEVERRNAASLLTTVMQKCIICCGTSKVRAPIPNLRLCKNYLTMKALCKDVDASSNTNLNSLYGSLESDSEKNELKAFEAALSVFDSSEISDEIKGEVLYCSTTNQWDDFLNSLIDMTDELAEVAPAVNEYLSVIEVKHLYRRCIQMYLYSSIARLLAVDKGALLPLEETQGKAIASLFKKKELIDFQSAIERADIDVEDYITRVKNMARLFNPAMEELFNRIDAAPDNGDKARKLITAYSVVKNKDLTSLVSRLKKYGSDDLLDVQIPCIALVHEPSRIMSVIHQLSYEPNGLVCSFLGNRLISNLLGGFYTNFYYAVYENRVGNYEKAQLHFDAAGDCPYRMTKAYEELKKAIIDRTDVGSLTDSQNVPIATELPQLSFMSECDPGDKDIVQLLAEFYTESDSANFAMKCQTAQKVFSLLKKGESIREPINFIFNWGFYVFNSEIESERRLEILFELLDNSHLLTDEQAFKMSFVNSFGMLLNDLEFDLFLKNLPSLTKHYNQLFDRFSPFDDCKCNKDLLDCLLHLQELSSSDIDTNKVKPRVESIQQSVLAIRATYPQSRFAKRCKDFVDSYIEQIYARGIFEVKILNKDQRFNGSIFYQIKNVGFETISNISISLYIEGAKETTIVSIDVSEGLRPKQIFPGEYVPKMDYSERKEICCIIQLAYADKNYIAIDGSQASGGMLKIVRDDYVYRRKVYAKYPEATILSSDQRNYINRKAKIEEIISGLFYYNQNVILYGTNGTGKSSILNKLLSTFIPQETKNHNIPICIEVKTDKNCSEKTIVEGLLDKICDNPPNGERVCELKSELEMIRYDHPELANLSEDALNKVQYYFSQAKRYRQELKIVNDSVINSDAIINLFKNISKALEVLRVKLYLLWDNFELVISSAKINPVHMGFLRSLDESDIRNNIRFVLAGSNYLLEAVSIEDEQGNSWNQILRGFSKVKIGNFSHGKATEFQEDDEQTDDDFTSLLRRKSALNDGEIDYTNEAIEFLWQYTRGHAFISCILGNKTLEILNKRHIGRHWIYPSDVYEAIKNREEAYTQGSDISTSRAIGSEIYQDIENNIEVQVVGKVLADEIMQGASKVSVLKLKSRVLRMRPEIIEQSFNKAVAVLYARDFIQETDRDPRTNDFDCSFTSDMYLEWFYLHDIPQPSTLEDAWVKRVQEIIEENAHALSEENAFKIITKIPQNVRDKISGHNNFINISTQGGDFLTGNSQKTVNNVNVLSVLNGIFANGADGRKMLSELQRLPRLNEYLDLNDPELPRLLNDVNGDDSEKASEAEAIITAGTDRMAASYRAALTSQDGFQEHFCIWEVLGYDDEDGYYKLSETLEPSFMTDLYFAAKLDSIFRYVEDKSDTPHEIKDYSPVSIMYCKVLEKMLKFYHTELYCKRVPDVSTEVKSKTNGTKITFGELGKIDNARRKAEIQNAIMIGAFLYPINPKYVDDGNKNWGQIANSELDYKKKKWKKHGRVLNRVKDIRNCSAHGTDGVIVSRDMLTELKNLLFRESGLENIVELCK